MRNKAGGNPGRSSGILVHITSLPGGFGIGDLGPAANQCVDDLARARQSWWQILPLGPPGAGNSPYQCFSAFAGNPDLISPERLVEDGLISDAAIPTNNTWPARVDYPAVHAFKQRILDRAWQNFAGGSFPQLQSQFAMFRSQERFWLNDFALFMAVRQSLGGASFTSWPQDLLMRKPGALARVRRALASEISRHRFIQFLFFRQLKALRHYAQGRGIGLIGDLPMFVSPDSADVWSNPQLFLLDDRRKPRVVAGVPPDYFCKTGQRWGNPLYNWVEMKRAGFEWWVRRVETSLKQCDLLRIDHFRGFEACWEIPAAGKTAKFGRWAKSPGKALLEALRQRIGSLPFIAEDLGVITPGVERLRDDFALPGMRVLQFAFGSDARNPFLPHNHVRNSVVYTGTHDNDTAVGWHATLNKEDRKRLHDYAPDSLTNVSHALLRLTLGSVADRAIVPVQDILGLGSEARMNVPGQPSGNWGWRMQQPLGPQFVESLRNLTELYGRAS